MVGILLSAGCSNRMGEPKALKEYQNLPFVINITLKLLSVCEKVIIVLGHNSSEIYDTFITYAHGSRNKNIESLFELEKVKVVINMNYEAGMFSSLKKGLEYCKSHETFLYHMIDQPHLPLEFYEEFAENYTNTIKWIQPMYNNIKGHPIIFSNYVKDCILKFDDSADLRTVIRKCNIARKYWECKFPAIAEDIDTKLEYERLINNN